MIDRGSGSGFERLRGEALDCLEASGLHYRVTVCARLLLMLVATAAGIVAQGAATDSPRVPSRELLGPSWMSASTGSAEQFAHSTWQLFKDGKLAEARRHCRQGLNLALASEDAPREAQLLMMMACIESAVGRDGHAARLLAMARDRAEETKNSVALVPAIERNLAYVHYLNGRFDDAIALWQPVHEQSTGVPRMLVGMQLVYALARNGQGEQAGDMLETLRFEIDDVPESQRAYLRGRLHVTVADWHAAAGRNREAEQAYSSWAALTPQAEEPAFHADRLDWAALRVGGGDVDGALALLSEVDSERLIPRDRVRKQKLRSRCCQLRGDLAGALAAQVSAAEITDSMYDDLRRSAIDVGLEVATIEHQRELGRLRQEGLVLQIVALAASVLALSVLVVTLMARGRRRRREAALLQARSWEAERMLQLSERSNAFKTEVLGLAAHDIRNPLTVILASVQQLQHEPSSGSESSYEAINRSAVAINTLVKGFLARVRRGDVELDAKPEEVDLRALVRDILEENAIWIGQKNLCVDMSSVPPNRVFVDGLLLRQVLANLVSNAVKYTPESGAVSIRATVDRGQLRLSVSDSGPGIADPERVFERFETQDAESSDPRGSLGLGMANTRTLVSALSGRIDVTSTLGVGSEFVVEVPVELQAAKSRGGGAAPAGARTPE